MFVMSCFRVTLFIIHNLFNPFIRVLIELAAVASDYRSVIQRFANAIPTNVTSVIWTKTATLLITWARTLEAVAIS